MRLNAKKNVLFPENREFKALLYFVLEYSLYKIFLTVVHSAIIVIFYQIIERGPYENFTHVKRYRPS